MPPIPPEAAPPEGIRRTSSYIPLLAYVAGVFFLVLAGFQTFQQIESLIQQEKLNDLNAIAAMKIGQIVSWRESQQRRGEALSSTTLLPLAFEQWMHQGAPAGPSRQKIAQAVSGLQQVYGYQAVSLVDRQGALRFTSNSGGVLDQEDVDLARQAMKEGKTILSDIHLNSGDGKVGIDLAAPLIVDEGNRRVVGAAILQIDPADFLYPLIRVWPVHSSSAETLLVRQEGGSLLFLNELRHRQAKALTLRLPVDTPNLPTGMFLRGKLDPLNSVDYRGVAVVAAVAKVPGTPWLMVAKVDKDEVFAPIVKLKQWSTAVGLVFLAGCGILFFVWLQGNQTRYRHLKAQRDAAIERELLTKHFEYLTQYANDMILVANENGEIIEANERAVSAYGYTRDELLGMPIWNLRPSADDLSVFHEQIVRFGKSAGLTFETTNRRKDGSIFPVEVSARIIEMAGVRYLQGIIRDISERKRAEEELLRQKSFFRQVIDADPNLIFVKNAAGRLLLANRATAILYGVTPDEMLDEKYLTRLKPPGNEAELYLEMDREVIRERQPVSFVHPSSLGGKERWFLTSKTPMALPDGTVNVLGISVDITERKLAEDELRKSAERIEDLYNNAPCGYHSLDKNGVIRQVNDTELAWLGYTRDEVIGKMKWTDLITSASRLTFQKNFPQFKEQGFVHDLEFEILRKDGTILVGVVSATAIYDSSGNFVMSRSMVFDITARRLAQDSLRESEARFRAMADNAPIIIWMADAHDGQNYSGCGFFNQGWHDFTGLTLAQTQGRNWLELVHPDDRARCLHVYQDAFRLAQPFKHEYRLMRHDGDYRWILDSGVPRFTEGGKLLGFIGTGIDITEQKSSEAMRSEIERVGRLNIAVEMASGLAHELSQPLAAANNYLTGCLHRMKEADWDKEKLQMAVELTHKQTERAGNIINHLKNLIRKQGHKRLMTDINGLIGDTVDFLEYEIKQRGIRVSMALSPLPLVLVNKVEIEQVLINLFKNAFEAMHGVPGPELRIVTANRCDSGHILVTISDNGMGIFSAELATIFNPFHTSKGDGIGLGLAICRSLVENHGGRIWAEAQPEFGAEFNFTLPFEASHD